jgi:hypothetical protein
MTDVYSPGQIVYPSATFTVPSGFAAPANVTITAVIQDPAGTEASLPLGAVVINTPAKTATATATGFTIPDTAAADGWWYVRFKATVDIVDTHEYAFYVARSAVLA